MKTRLLCTLIALACSTAALAQDAPPANNAQPPMNRATRNLPPPPPGCDSHPRAHRRHPALPDLATDTEWRKAIGVTPAQAREVQKVVSEQAALSRKLEQQHLALDASTCSKLRAIVGDKGIDRWMAAAPPPPRPPMPPRTGRSQPPSMPPPPPGAPQFPDDGR